MHDDHPCAHNPSQVSSTNSRARHRAETRQTCFFLLFFFFAFFLYWKVNDFFVFVDGFFFLVGGFFFRLMDFFSVDGFFFC